MVLPRRLRSERLQCGKDPIQTVEGGERLGAEHAGVVGDLVVVNVVDVDALGPLTHFLRNDRGVEIALHDVGGGTKNGEGPAAVNARQDVEAVLSGGGLPALLHQLRNGPYHPAGKPLGIGQEPGEGAPRSGQVTGAAEVAHRQDGAARHP